jgi:hypothetical protein
MKNTKPLLLKEGNSISKEEIPKSVKLRIRFLTLQEPEFQYKQLNAYREVALGRWDPQIGATSVKNHCEVLSR